MPSLPKKKKKKKKKKEGIKVQKIIFFKFPYNLSSNKN